MIPGVIAKRYATALLEIGVETSSLDTLVQEMERAAATYESSSELRSSLDNPLVPLPAKRAILQDVANGLSMSDTGRNALGLLLDRRRMRALPAIAQRLKEMADEKRGLLRAQVLTAMPLPEDYYQRLQAQLERVTGRRIALDRKLDPTLICGVVARVGDTVYDGSILSRLKQMRDSLMPSN